MNRLILLLILIVLVFGGWLMLAPIINNKSDSDKKMDTENLTTATMKTNKGEVVLELFTKKMPITTANFIKLAKEGYYNGTKFHRVIKGFMIQGGDILSKDDSKKDLWGTGGSGYTIEDEFVAGLSNVRGTIAMANTGQPNSGGSQFFINLVDNTGLDFDKEPLASKHPVFGRVIGGTEVMDLIGKTATDEADRPLEDVIINEVVIKEPTSDK